ncbi:MAG: hypothetical protein COY68_03125 [Candidatus Levybacteria bacterium CG_4_10_14_0_8_um_filter_35_23]|nr:MAG: hypothetical protein COY68_03125 [Candidatus Levybacteria bacterium CG_4_10_14_0_8_um_filter_35_23]
MKLYKLFVSFLIISLLFIGFFHPIISITQDLGRHFLLGEIILKTLSVPKTNLFSYTYPDFPFVNLHWLSEVLFFVIFKTIGFNGLLIFSTTIVIASFGLMFFKLFKSNNFLALSGGSILYLLILFERTDIRPEIFSFLFLSIFLAILYKYREKYTKWIFLLPFIEILWVNMHIYFIIGNALLFFFLLENIILKRKKLFSKKTKVLGAIFLLSLVAALINPNWITGATYPLFFQQNYGYTIEENQNIFFLWELFQKQTILYFAISSFLLLSSFLILFKKTRLVDLLLSAFFIFLATSAIRNFPLFVFGTFFVFVYNYSFILSKLSSNIKKLFYVLLPIVLIFLIFNVSAKKGFGFGVESGATKGTDFFLKNNLQNPLFNNFDIGSYLDYRFYPKIKVFIDSRPESYPADFIKNTYIPMQYDEKIFSRFDNSYNFNSIFFSYLDQTPWANTFLYKIVRNPKWKIVYIDDYSIILVKDNEQNKRLITTYGMDINNLKFSNLNDNFLSFVKASIFLNKTGLKDQEIEMYEKILTVNPNYCPALYNLSLYYSNVNSDLSRAYFMKFQNFCK